MSNAAAITTDTAMLMPVLIWNEPNPFSPDTLFVDEGAGGEEGTGSDCAAPQTTTAVSCEELVQMGLPVMFLCAAQMNVSDRE